MKCNWNNTLKRLQSNHPKTSETHNNNNVMGNYDNSSTTGKDIGSTEIDLQAGKDLEDDSMQFKRQETTQYQNIARHLLLTVPTQKMSLFYFLVVHVLLPTNSISHQRYQTR